MNDKRSDPVLYDHSSGYYVSQPDLIQVPWDNDDFTLCLDSFSSKRIIGSKYVKYPTTASPLRRQWRSSNTSSDAPQEEDKEENKSITLPGIDEEKKDEAWILSKKPVITKKKRFVKQTDDTFPYNNSSHLFHQVDNNPKKKLTKIAIPRHPSQRAEHVSPLSDSSILLRDENDIFNTSPQLSPRISFARRHSNASSCLPSIASVSSFNLLQSQGESWKVAQQRPWRSNSPIIVSTAPTIYSRPNTPIHSMELNHKASTLSEQPSNSSEPHSTQHKTTDRLAFYANRTSSVYSNRDSLSSKPRTYSGYFNPTFSLLNKKAKRRHSQKKSMGLFSKLVKNLKHHFVKTQ